MVTKNLLCSNCFLLQFIFFLLRNISCQAKLCRAIVTTPNAVQQILLKDLTGRNYQRRLFKSIGGLNFCCGERTHSPGGEGGGGSIFWKTRDIGLASYSNNLSTGGRREKREVDQLGVLFWLGRGGRGSDRRKTAKQGGNGRCNRRNDRSGRGSSGKGRKDRIIGRGGGERNSRRKTYIA